MFVEAYQRLFDSYGPQGWWPGDSPLEVMVGAVLTQNTNWRNVERAIQNLKDAHLLTLPALRHVSHEELAAQIRPAGYYRLKATRLKNLILFVDEQFGTLDAMFASELPALRRALLAVNGIGPETADAILLYAGGFPTFVIDTYAARIVQRHGWIDSRAKYDDLKLMFENQLSKDVSLFNEFHALIVMVGKLHCRRSPHCDGCPLESMLASTGPLDV